MARRTKRKLVACERCRKTKSKCVKSGKSCEVCKKRNIQCSWQLFVPHQAIKRTYETAKIPKFDKRHHARADNLLEWKSIIDLVNEEIENTFVKGTRYTPSTYSMMMEKSRGEIRVHDWGEGEDNNHPFYANQQFPATHSSSVSAVFQNGKGPGRLNENELLDLREPTVDRLMDSYKEKMHILHPFLSLQQIERLRNKLMGNASTDGHKRRRTDGEYELSLPGQSNDSDKSQNNVPTRSMASAIILLILALGEICEHIGKVPDIAENPGISNRRFVPGMAYFASAIDMMSDQISGSSVSHIQANILVALYYSQLIRPAQSHAYLSIASRAIQEQIELDPSIWKTEEDYFCKAEENMDIIMAFWTCVELECDLVTEHPYIYSGILIYEELVKYPIPKDGEMFKSHDGQLWLRKYLNHIIGRYYMSPGLKVIDEAWSEIEQISDFIEGGVWNFTTDILSARIRARFYGLLGIIYRPVVKNVVEELRREKLYNLDTIDKKRRDLVTKGVEALVNSITAFRDIHPNRLIVANVFSVAHAQWGNALVLLACSQVMDLSQIDIKRLVQDTLSFLTSIAHQTSALRIDIQLLRAAAKKIGVLDESDMHFNREFRPGDVETDPISLVNNESFQTLVPLNQQNGKLSESENVSKGIWQFGIL